MNKSNIEVPSAETKADSITTAQNEHVTQLNANTNVVGSLFSQREIKFRAWLIPDDDFESELPYMTYDLAFEDYAPLNEQLKSVSTLMQYTGLKDKNGKEIYEGDIVEANGSKTVLVKDNSDARRFVSPIFKDEYKSDNGRFLFIVFWQNCFSGFLFRAIEKMVSINCEVNSRDFMVKGNIFENPELLDTLL